MHLLYTVNHLWPETVNVITGLHTLHISRISRRKLSIQDALALCAGFFFTTSPEKSQGQQKMLTSQFLGITGRSILVFLFLPPQNRMYTYVC